MRKKVYLLSIGNKQNTKNTKHNKNDKKPDSENFDKRHKKNINKLKNSIAKCRKCCNKKTSLHPSHRKTTTSEQKNISKILSLLENSIMNSLNAKSREPSIQASSQMVDHMISWMQRISKRQTHYRLS